MTNNEPNCIRTHAKKEEAVSSQFAQRILYEPTLIALQSGSCPLEKEEKWADNAAHARDITEPRECALLPSEVTRY